MIIGNLERQERQQSNICISTALISIESNPTIYYRVDKDQCKPHDSYHPHIAQDLYLEKLKSIVSQHDQSSALDQVTETLDSLV